jgi:AcrR family transcriptional regulator
LTATQQTEFTLKARTRKPAPVMGRRAQRTSALIRDKAREVFLSKGYFGTTIDDIADAAGVSRSSFYTYYPTKRDVLLTLGRATYSAMDGLLEELTAIADTGADDAVEQIVALYLRMLDEHGAFLQVWGQAGFGDEELRRDGMRAKLSVSRRLAVVFQKLGWVPAGQDPALVAFALENMWDRFWYYHKVAGLPATHAEVVATLSSIVRATIEHR